MTENISSILYLVSSVCFIMALRGLSSPETSRQGNVFGIAGMVVAIGTTLALPSVLSYEVIIAGIVIGGAIGSFIAWKIEMTALPQLVGTDQLLPAFGGAGRPLSGGSSRRIRCRQTAYRCIVQRLADPEPSAGLQGRLPRPRSGLYPDGLSAGRR